MEFIIIERPKRTNKEHLTDDYGLFMVAISRMLRGEKPRLKTLFK